MTDEELAQKAAAVPVTEFVAKKVKIAVTDAEGKFFDYIAGWIQCFSAQQQREESSGSLDDDELEKYIKQLPNDKSQISSLLKAIMPADFEKDDDSNRHIDFIVACSNLRAENYGIEPADRSKSKVSRICLLKKTIVIFSALLDELSQLSLQLPPWLLVLFLPNFTKLLLGVKTLKSIETHLWILPFQFTHSLSQCPLQR